MRCHISDIDECTTGGEGRWRHAAAAWTGGGKESRGRLRGDVEARSREDVGSWLPTKGLCLCCLSLLPEACSVKTWCYWCVLFEWCCSTAESEQIYTICLENWSGKCDRTVNHVKVYSDITMQFHSSSNCWRRVFRSIMYLDVKLKLSRLACSWWNILLLRVTNWCWGNPRCMCAVYPWCVHMC